MTTGAGTNGDNVGFVRGMQLRRRRSRVPWIYAVYHARHRRHRTRRHPWNWAPMARTLDLEPEP
jgi:hypothetical protein